MIINKKPVSIPFVLEKIKNDKIENKEFVDFLKKFSKIDYKKSEKIIDDLNELGLVKINEEVIVKIIDLLPQTHQELNKIFLTGLSEEESNKILEIIKRNN